MHLVKQNNTEESYDTDALQREKRFQLARLLLCTEDMLLFAKNGDWESVQALENSRRDEIKACFTVNSVDESPLIAEAFATLIFLNDQITTLVREAKSEVMSSHQTLLKSKSAVGNYQSQQKNY